MSDFKPELLTHPGRSRRRQRKNMLVWLLAGTLIAVITIFTLVYTYYSARAGFINIKVIEEMPQASILYDYQGHAFSRFFDENRIALPRDQPVPTLLGEAVVATEDRRFYNHGAIDPYGIVRATVSDIVHRGGGERQGASTITQQLARNSIGQMQRTYDRKLLEIFLAHRIELAYTKKQILRYYLDRIYFGQGLYGAETTANAFFGLPASKLNLAQCAAGGDDLESERVVAVEGYQHGEGGAGPGAGADGEGRLHHAG
jgi:penicillin-binding protein 1A